ncbi:MAG TPA: TIGR01777 family oxidoreductase [Salinivirgaceae bacterium]|nr:TIGR01777 family oxidoreductase [Salinivirgaceae bacterium]
MEIYIAGGSGFLGSSLAQTLDSLGFCVTIITRKKTVINTSSNIKYITYNDLNNLTPAANHVVVNLAGSNIGAGRWTKKQKTQILHSRIDTTQLLLKSFAKHSPRVWIQGSAVGYYGISQNESFTEDSGKGEGFLATVTAEWESSVDINQLPNTRIVFIRTGVVLSSKGGMLRKLIPIFRYGMGAIFGDGLQPLSWISIEDWVRAVVFLLENPKSRGVYNLTAPETLTNKEFSHRLAATLRRKVFFTIPKGILRLLLGEMAEEMLLNGQKVYPQRLLSENFHFKHPSPEKFFECYLLKELKKVS